MKILWITNMVFPEVMTKIGLTSGTSGGWMFDLADGLSQKPDIELAIASIYSGSEFRKEVLNNKTYYMMPGGGRSLLLYDRKLIPYWQKIENEFQPDIVHLHGTEYKHGLVYMDTYPNKCFLLTIQGIMKPITREYWAGLGFRDLLRTLNWNEFKRGKSIFAEKYLAYTQALSEEKIIKRVSYLTGRSDWDKAMLAAMNPKARYFRCNYNLRSEFYSAAKWSPESIERYTIYGSTALQISYKGGESLIKAVALVRDVYPQVKVKALLPGRKDGKFYVKTGYQKLVKYWLDKYQLWDNFDFLSGLSAQGVIDTMLKCHCCVVPSAMENASSSLREAMHLGVPSIASFRGGMTHLIDDRVDGFFFDYPEYPVLAMRIMELFQSDDLCMNISRNAIEKAEKWHDRKQNVDSMYNVYKEINKTNKL